MGKHGSETIYADQQGGWKEVTPNELKRLLALIIYFGFVKVNQFHDYWSTKSLYRGLWTRNMLKRDRFKAIITMLHIVDFSKESKEDKLKRVRHFIDHMCQRCRKLYQPSANVAIEERMVKSKHRSGMRQYMPLNPVKFGLKLWVLAYSLNGYIHLNYVLISITLHMTLIYTQGKENLFTNEV